MEVIAYRRQEQALMLGELNGASWRKLVAGTCDLAQYCITLAGRADFSLQAASKPPGAQNYVAKDLTQDDVRRHLLDAYKQGASSMQCRRNR
jgi:hypothetical protein